MNNLSSSRISETDWERVSAMTDAEIDLSDIPETTAEQMARSTFRINRVPVERKAEKTPVPNWIDRLTGSISNDELFVEALEYGRSLRVADSYSDNTV